MQGWPIASCLKSLFFVYVILTLLVCIRRSIHILMTIFLSPSSLQRIPLYVWLVSYILVDFPSSCLLGLLPSVAFSFAHCVSDIRAGSAPLFPFHIRIHRMVSSFCWIDAGSVLVHSALSQVVPMSPHGFCSVLGCIVWFRFRSFSFCEALQSGCGFGIFIPFFEPLFLCLRYWCF